MRDINGFKIEKNLDVAMAMDAAMAEAMRFPIWKAQTQSFRAKLRTIRPRHFARQQAGFRPARPRSSIASMTGSFAAIGRCGHASSNSGPRQCMCASPTTKRRALCGGERRAVVNTDNGNQPQRQ